VYNIFVTQYKTAQPFWAMDVASDALASSSSPSNGLLLADLSRFLSALALIAGKAVIVAIQAANPRSAIAAVVQGWLWIWRSLTAIVWMNVSPVYGNGRRLVLSLQPIWCEGKEVLCWFYWLALTVADVTYHMVDLIRIILPPAVLVSIWLSDVQRLPFLRLPSTLVRALLAVWLCIAAALTWTEVWSILCLGVLPLLRAFLGLQGVLRVGLHHIAYTVLYVCVLLRLSRAAASPALFADTGRDSLPRICLTEVGEDFLKDFGGQEDGGSRTPEGKEITEAAASSAGTSMPDDLTELDRRK